MGKLICPNCKKELKEVTIKYNAIFCSYCELYESNNELWLTEREGQLEDYFDGVPICENCGKQIDDEKLCEEIFDLLDK